MRRTFRRHIRKTLAPDVPPILQEANFAFDKGEYGRAGELFENLAQSSDARGGGRAPIYHLQAGRARLFAGQTNLGLPSLKRGLELLAQRGQLAKLNHFGDRTLSDLKGRELTSEAEEIESWLRKLAPPMPSFETNHTLDTPKLPSHCPACGAGVHPAEVDWTNELTADCAYCGSRLR